MTDRRTSPLSDSHSDAPADSPIDRRRFMQTSAAAVTAAAFAGTQPIFAHIAGDDRIRVGLVGCGGRGTGAAVNALTADPNTVLVAMGDAFQDRLDGSLNNLTESEVADRIEVNDDMKFVGFDCHEHVIAACDVVLLASPPHFRPAQIEAAVKAGKHCFAEKPVATDAPGLRRVMDAAKQAKEKSLTLTSGLCYRYQDAKQQVIEQIHNGAVGEIRALECTYNTGALWHHGRKPEWSDMEWQVRNWLYFTWLSGDHIAEQSIHSIDKILWAMQDEAPVKATASGGRIVRTDPKFGNVYDHFNTVFEWENGVRGFHSCRQWAGADANVSDYVYGTQGTAAIQHHRIRGENEWRFKGKSNDMYVAEHVAMFDSIRNGKAKNDGDYMCKSTLMSIMGRMSAYTGKTITWEQALNSKEDLTPAEYAWGELEVAPVARPGQTPFL